VAGTSTPVVGHEDDPHGSDAFSATQLQGSFETVADLFGEDRLLTEMFYWEGGRGVEW